MWSPLNENCTTEVLVQSRVKFPGRSWHSELQMEKRRTEKVNICYLQSLTLHLQNLELTHGILCLVHILKFSLDVSSLGLGGSLNPCGSGEKSSGEGSAEAGVL